MTAEEIVPTTKSIQNSSKQWVKWVRYCETSFREDLTFLCAFYTASSDLNDPWPQESAIINKAGSCGRDPYQQGPTHGNYSLSIVHQHMLKHQAALSKWHKHQQYKDGPEEIQQQADSKDGWVQVGKNSCLTMILHQEKHSRPRQLNKKNHRGHKEDQETLEEWRSLRLDIQALGIHSIQNALVGLVQPQNISVQGKGKGEGEIELKRFQYVPGSSLSSLSTSTSAEEGESVRASSRSHHHNGAGVNRGMNRNPNVIVGGSIIKIKKQITFGPELVVGTDVLSVKVRVEAGLIGGIGGFENRVGIPGVKELQVLQKGVWEG
ncbi:hypothetical protein EV361DRAFT_874051 [Lentinula raphanica]|nr:hypothetical protein EV361DRAFT_874051 [Lentinula raphanica]